MSLNSRKTRILLSKQWNVVVRKSVFLCWKLYDLCNYMVLWKNKGLIHRTIINVDIFFSEICEKICNLLVADNWTKIYKQNLVIGHLTFTSKCTLRLLFLINNYIILMFLTMKRGLINKSWGILTITVIKCVKNCCGHYLNSNTKETLW